MNIDVQKLSNAALDNLIANYRKQNAVTHPTYRGALAERIERRGRGLTCEKSFRCIRGAAKERRFLSYKELADASNVEWNKAHYAIGGHLWDLIEPCYLRGWPVLSAIVVNKPNVKTGLMEPATLKGFVGAARLLGYVVTDELAFLQMQQAEVFAWAASSESENYGF